MDWLRRIRSTPDSTGSASDDTIPGPVERAAPGIAALLAGVSEDRSHAVLDLGPAADSSLRVHSRFARRVRFADLITDIRSPRGWAAALSALPPHPGQPYDLVFAWDLLDQLFPQERSGLVERLTELTSPGARLHVVAEASERATTHPLRFTLLDVDRIRYEPTGPARPARRPLLPADVEHLLGPFQVIRAFTWTVGLREYVAVRKGGTEQPAARPRFRAPAPR